MYNTYFHLSTFVRFSKSARFCATGSVGHSAKQMVLGILFSLMYMAIYKFCKWSETTSVRNIFTKHCSQEMSVVHNDS